MYGTLCDYHDQLTEERPDAAYLAVNPDVVFYRCVFTDGWHIIKRQEAMGDDDER